MPRALTPIAIDTIFGNLRVIGVGKIARGRNGYMCICDCGRHVSYSYTDLTAGRTISCGCVRNSKGNPKHGLTYVDGKVRSEHAIWSKMKSRCYDKDSNGWDYYGGRGIIICDRWLNNFENFFADMGQRPSTKHSIERKNNNGNYEPSNCHWATKTDQARNRRTTHLIEYRGREMSLIEACELAGVDYHAAQYRISVGKPFDTPIRSTAKDFV